MHFNDLVREFNRRHEPFEPRLIPRRFWYGPGTSRRLVILVPNYSYPIDEFPLNFLLENLPPITFCLTPRYPPADFVYHGTIRIGTCEHNSRGPNLHLPNIFEFENDPLYQLALATTKAVTFIQNLGDQTFCGTHKKVLPNR